MVFGVADGCGNWAKHNETGHRMPFVSLGFVSPAQAERLTLRKTSRMLAGVSFLGEYLMALNITLGIDDFRTIRDRRVEYVDKTHLITDLIDRPRAVVMVLPRPRRFGKSLNLSTLRYFFEKRDENLWHLFEGLHVSRAGEAYKAHFQQYPVIYLSFKGTRGETFAESWSLIQQIIQNAFVAHEKDLEGRLDARQWEAFQSILRGTADKAHYHSALSNLTEYLHEVHGKRPIVLIDEYDAPIHAGYAKGYYQEIVGFVRLFFESGLKDNPHLERAILTGILRVSKESIFSGMNNAIVYSLLEQEFNTCFGFTDAEVFALLEKAGAPEMMDGVRSYYNGYEFGGVAIYNPWSILHFLSSDTRQLVPYWLNTSSNDLIKELLQHYAFSVDREFEALLRGASIEKELNENIALPELTEQEDALWSLLVFSGYLKAARGPVIPGQPRPPHQLSIPNQEVMHVYRTTFRVWLDKVLHTHSGGLKRLLEGLLQGDVLEVVDQLQIFAAKLPSYHDVRGANPEKFYHGLMLGLLASLEPEYEVRSNRESGNGRPDVLIKPRRPGKPGVVLELKSGRRSEGRTIKQALLEGLEQFRDNDYAAELRAAGVDTVHSMVVAFDGKKVAVELADAYVEKKPRAPRKTTTKTAKTTKKTTKRARK